MRYRFIIATLIAGIVITITGLLFKLSHWEGAMILQFVGIAIVIIGMILMMIKLGKGYNQNRR